MSRMLATSIAQRVDGARRDLDRDVSYSSKVGWSSPHWEVIVIVNRL